MKVEKWCYQSTQKITGTTQFGYQDINKNVISCNDSFYAVNQSSALALSNEILSSADGRRPIGHVFRIKQLL